MSERGLSGFGVDRSRVTSVATNRGDIECEYVVNCGGQWAKALAARVGVTVPLQPAEHYYIVTEVVDGLERSAPTLRDPDGYTYFKEEVRGLLMGGFEPDAKPWVASDEIPEPFEFQLLPEDWEQFDILMRNAVHRVPAMESVGVKKFYNGPESFTPDHNFVMGQAPELDNYFVLAGFNSSGIAFSGGTGKALAEWIIAGEPELDLSPVDIRRFAPMQGNKRWLRGRVQEIVGLHFAMAWPNREPESARGVRRSPVHHLLEARGACFGTKMGWERVNWFAPAGTKPVVEYSWGRQNWFGYSAAEHAAARAEVALFDQTSFAKIAVRGADAEAALQYLCSNDVAVPPGRTVYTALLNDRGGYEADVTVTRLRWNEYLLVTSSAQGVHDLDLLRRGVPPGLHVEFFDVTSSYAVLSVMGPRSRALLGGLSSDDFSAEAFAFGDSREVDLGGLTVRATRLTYVGELGWELYVPSEVAVAAFERLTDPGQRGRAQARRVLRDRVAPAGEGVPGVRPRTRPGHHAGRGGPLVHVQAGHVRRLPRPRSGGAAEDVWRGAAAGEPRRGRPCRVRVGRRAAAPRRRASRVRQLSRVRPQRRPDRAARLHRAPRRRGRHEGMAGCRPVPGRDRRRAVRRDRVAAPAV